MCTTSHHAKARGLAPEALIALVVGATVLVTNGPLWRAVFSGRDPLQAGTWTFAGLVLAALAAWHFCLVALFTPRAVMRPVLGVLVVSSAMASYFMQHFGVMLDPAMMRSVLATDVRESAELVSAGSLGVLAASLAAAAAIWAVPLRSRPWRRAMLLRAGSCAGAALVGTAATLAVYQDLSSLLRNDPALRHSLLPASLAWASARALAGEAHATIVRRDPPDPAVRSPAPAATAKPILFVVVIGETARAANFALNGYARDTTPELGRIDLLNFSHTRACGTSTAVSLPCMFSPFGRADYDETRIRKHDSALHVLARAGFRVVWLDNQSGCKGVCTGLEAHRADDGGESDLCAADGCYDEVLARELDPLLARASGDSVVVLHQIGNHGPAYFRRYPAGRARFQPACERAELRDCSREEIVNAYDNAIAYTDHFLAAVISRLESVRARFDVGLLYVSDHGESLGENGVYLHGIPYLLAPREQLDVPMFWWLPAASASRLRVDTACVRARSSAPASHDNVYHSLLGLMDVRTPYYRAARDLFSGCRTGHPA